MSNRVVQALYCLAFALTAGFLATVLYLAIRADGKIEYCFIDNISGQTGGYEIIGYRPWRGNAHLGVAGSPEGANVILSNSALCQKK